ERAERYYNQAVKLTPRNAAVLERQAKFYLTISPPKAEAAFEQLCELDPTNTGHRFVLAAPWASSENEAKFEKAMQLLSKDVPGTERAPAQHVANRRVQAILLMRRGEAKDDAEAMRLLRELLDVTTNPASMDRLLLAQLYERQGNLDQAKRQYQYLVEPKTPEAAPLEAYLNFLLRHGSTAEYQQQLERLESLETNKLSLRLVRWKAQGLKQQKNPAAIETLVSQ